MSAIVDPTALSPAKPRPTGPLDASADALAAVAQTTTKPKKREPLERRTYSPIRHNSWLAGGEWERAQGWLCVQDEAKLGYPLEALEAVLNDLISKHPSKRGRPKQWPHKLVEIAKLILDWKTTTGVMTMTVAKIAEMAKCGLSTAYAHLKTLKLLGFVEWQRRGKPTGERGTRGQKYEQTSSVYRLCQVAAHIAQMFKPKPRPKPKDEATLRAELEAEKAKMRRAMARERDHRERQIRDLERRVPATLKANQKAKAEEQRPRSEALVATLTAAFKAALS
jgi:hypothetical protein